MEPILAATFVVYALRLMFFGIGQVRAAYRRGHNVARARVTIIIPARNEEQNLDRCIASLKKLTYPHELLQIIIVNDRSTDRTADIIDEAAKQWPVLTALHRSDEHARDNLRGKPGALQYGADHATGEILLFTDADCVVSEAWIQTMTSPFADESVGMVCGFTTIEHSTAFGLLQDVEWLYTHSMAQGALTNGHILGCFGNNMAVRMQDFVAIGGYHSVAFSITEDLALLQAMVRSGHTVRYICSADAAVESLPCLTLREYIQQKQRWVRGALGLGWRGFLFSTTSITYWMGLVWSVASGNLTSALLFLALRAFGDGILIAISVIRLRRWGSIPAIAPSLLLLLFLEIILPILAFRKKVVWKEQTF